ncbi:MAG: GerMN domain-containing protein [Acidimicrobiales bacterium]
MRRPCSAAAVFVAAVFVAAVCLAGCGIPNQEVAHVAPDKDVPTGLLHPTAPTTSTIPPANGTAAVIVCLAHAAGPLTAVTRLLPRDPTTDDVLRELANPPTALQQAFGLGTVVPSGIRASVAGGIASVALNADFATLAAADQLTAVAQIVCTLTDQPGIGQVQFKLHGMTADVPRGDGSTTSDPVSRDDYPTFMPSSPQVPV